MLEHTERRVGKSVAKKCKCSEQKIVPPIRKIKFVLHKHFKTLCPE